MVTREDIRNDLKVVRSELEKLKACQLRYFTLAVTGTAALIGASPVLIKGPFGIYTFLIPLIIILPCWTIFFDKATSITRNVGYVSVLEEMISDYPELRHKFIGYERSLLLFRMKEDMNEGPGVNEVFNDNRRSLLSAMLFRTRHQYWIINWYTFFILAVLSCVLSCFYLHWSKASQFVPLGIALLLVLLTLGKTMLMLNRLVRGNSSYLYHSVCWREYLKIN